MKTKALGMSLLKRKRAAGGAGPVLGSRKKVSPSIDGKRIEQAELRTEQAEVRTEQAEARTEQAEVRVAQAETRTEQAESRSERAKSRTEHAKARTEQAEMRTEQAETRTEQAETRTEQAIRDSEVRYRRLFESAEDGILILSAETGLVVDVNSFLIRTLGLSREEFLGKAVWELGFFKDIWGDAEKFAELRDKNHVRYEPLPLDTTTGERIDVEFVSNVYLVDGSKVIQCNVRDVTARRQAEEALRQLNASLEQRVLERTTQLEAANKDLEAFSYSVSHDLRAPLRAISGFSKIVLDDHSVALGADGLRYLHLVDQSAQQMSQLIDDLLTFSRTGRQPLEVQTVSTTDVVNACLSDLHGMQENRHVAISLGALPDCEADVSLLKQVWLNLLGNALKYTRKRDPAVITIGSRKENGTDTYFVQDNGAGFDMKYADKLFGVFQRLHLADDYEGTGVGLALVQRIVQRHGGRVWAEAKLNLGATFHFTLTGGHLA